VAHAHLVVLGGDFVDFLLGGVDAGQVGRRRQVGLLEDAAHRGVGALARGAARAVGYGDEARLDRRQFLNGVPQVAFELFRTRRKEFE
jgi:hypothetical protein